MARKGGKKKRKQGSRRSAGRGAKVAPQASQAPKGPEPDFAALSPLRPNRALAAIVGEEKLLYHDASRLVWMYVKRHRLQDSKDPLKINPDPTLKEIVGKATVTTVELTKAVREAMG